MYRFLIASVWMGFALSADCACAASSASTWLGNLTPEEALSAFELEPGLKVELVAAEPMVVAPCAIAWDDTGRMFVAENRGYPSGGPGGAAIGSVAVLQDTDGDGTPDRRTEFASGLTFPNGLLPWRGGLIVTCAPDVLFLRDTDGDGKADLREVLLTGFATNQSTQLRVNQPLLAQDGWVYLASGLSGGTITSPKRPGDQPMELRGDVRFRPDTGEYESIDGKSQFGQSFDDYGRRFGVHNRVQCQHFVLPSRYVARNPLLASPGVLQNTPELVDNPLLRGGGGAARIYPISANITTADSHAGTYSAACAVHVWRGGTLPDRFAGTVFSCDPTGNLVRYDQLIPTGATFSARRVGENVEFLRSRDNWFRPSYLATGPDGALYVADMYRRTIEHPDYLPEEVRRRTDFESGRDRGRIWKVTAERTGRDIAGLKDRSPEGLVRELSSAVSWRRDTAFRLLLEGRDPAALPGIRALAGDGRFPPGRAAALNLLALLGDLEDGQLLRAFDSGSTGVREVALRLAERRLAGSQELRDGVLRLAYDPEASVRFWCALVLGEMPGMKGTNVEPAAVWALAHVGNWDGADKWARAAVLSSIGNQAPFVLNELMPGADRLPPFEPSAALYRELARQIGIASRGDSNSAARFIHKMFCKSRWNSAAARNALLTGVAEGLAAGVANRFVLSERTAPGLPGCDSRAGLQAMAAAAAVDAADPARVTSRRLTAVEFLRWCEPAIAEPALKGLVGGDAPAEIQVAAVRALAAANTPGLAKELLAEDRWRGYSPAVRAAVLSSLLSRPDYHPGVLSMVECDVVPKGAIPAVMRDQWLKSNDAVTRRRAGKLFQPPGDRMQAYQAAKASLTLKASAENGRQVFLRLCADCHRFERDGHAVGPDLFDMRNQPKETILLHIVLPEQEIAPTFTAYVCETRDGRTLTGLLVAESPAAVTLRQAQGLEEVVARSQIKSLTASPLSMMPQELEKGMTLQELADLLGYLRGER